MTFRDLIGKKDITAYEVARSGSIRVLKNLTIDEGLMGYSIFHVGISNLDSNKTDLTNSGCVSSSCGGAIFLDANEAADLAEKIATTKYNNSIKAINKIRKEAVQ